MEYGLGYSHVLLGFVVIGVAAGCEEPLADGERECFVRVEGDCPEGYVCRRNRCPYGEFRCYHRQDGDRLSFDGPLCVVNGLCEPLACETWLNCPEDCGGQCDVARMTYQTASNALVDEFYFPRTTEEARELGLDLNGDGVVDNRLAHLLHLLVSFDLVEDPGVAFQRSLLSGELLLVTKLWTDDDIDLEEPKGLAQLLVGDVFDASPLFDGNDMLRISNESSSAAHLCGVVSGGFFRSVPTTYPVRLPLPLAVRGERVFVGTFTAVRVEGWIDPGGWMDVLVGGGITRETLSGELYPWLVDQFNHVILSEPGSRSALVAQDLFDSKCEPTMPGCDPPPSGCAQDGLISLDELLCNALLNSAAALDVDLDGDGLKDVLSAGFRIVSTVPVTLVE